MKEFSITTCVGCVNRCSYCPQDLFLKNYKGVRVLTLANFKKMLKNVSKETMIVFGGYSEPFQNPECSNMILYAHSQGHKVQVWTTFVGFTEKDAELIKDVPFQRFHHHNINNKPESYPFITDTITPDTLPVTTRAGALGERPYKEVTKCLLMPDYEKQSCVPNGDIYNCCMDWGLKHKVGNIFETHFDKIKGSKIDLCHYCEYGY